MRSLEPRAVTYREASPPPPQVFPLETGGRAQVAVVGGLIALILGLAIFALTGGAVVLLFVAAAPALTYLLGGGPRRIEIDADAVTVRYWMRAPRTFATRELIVQRMPDELVLIDGQHTVGLEGEQFPGKTFAECGDALGAVARDVVRPEVRPIRPPPRARAS
jgi:hypothetical protein